MDGPIDKFPQLRLLILENRAYLPLSGLALALAVAASALHVDRTPTRLLAGLLLVAALTGLTLRRLPEFRDDLSLWSAAIRTAPRSFYAQQQYGAALLEAEREEEALGPLAEAVRLNGVAPGPRLAFAIALARAGKTPAAVFHVQKVLSLWPGHVRANDLLKSLVSTEGD